MQVSYSKDATVYILSSTAAKATGEIVNPDALHGTLGDFLKWTIDNRFVLKGQDSTGYKVHLRLVYQSQFQVRHFLYA